MRPDPSSPCRGWLRARPIGARAGRRHARSRPGRPPRACRSDAGGARGDERGRRRDYRNDTLGANVSEKLSGVPGVLARTRQNYAQDEQLSIRGFGTRASFGIRGVRLYVDGVPATMPDGQGQLSHFPLAAAERIEVLRGPFSTLYGNAAGGVIQLFTPMARAPGELRRRGGGRQLRQPARSASVCAMHNGELDYVWASTTSPPRLSRRTAAPNARCSMPRRTWGVGAHAAALVANALWAPNAQDPLGLDRAQFEADPRQATRPRMRFNTRKSVTQRQLGAVLAHDRGRRATCACWPTRGKREVVAVPRHPGCDAGQPAQRRRRDRPRAPYAGVDMRWTQATTLAGRPLGVRDRARTTTGSSRIGAATRTSSARSSACAAHCACGRTIACALRPVRAGDMATGGRLVADGRRAPQRHRFRSRDHYITAEQSRRQRRGAITATSPVLGVGWTAVARWQLVCSVRARLRDADVQRTGLPRRWRQRPQLRAATPARTRSVGSRSAGTRGERVESEFALFRADTRDELTVDTSSGGRTTFQNAGDARRRGRGMVGAPFASLRAGARSSRSLISTPASATIS